MDVSQAGYDIPKVRMTIHAREGFSPSKEASIKNMLSYRPQFQKDKQ